MKDAIKQALKILGHALTVALHERLDHTDHALDLIIDQNNRMARAQTALLQASIHTVNGLNRVQAELAAIRRSVVRTAGRSDRLVDGIDRALAELAELKRGAESQSALLGVGPVTSEEFFRVYSDLPRQGPGSEASTLRAIGMLPPLPPKPRILDAGCGTGAPTLVLARELGGHVTAVDLHQPYLDELDADAHAAGLADRVVTRLQSMDALDEPPESLDLIWSEGAISLPGITRALALWHPLLKPGAAVAFTDASWLTDAAPDEARDFWMKYYPQMDTAEGNCRQIREAGYEVLGTFELPAEDWWRDYYTPLRARCAKLREQAAASPDLACVLDAAEEEIAMYERHGSSYGYVFYILRKPA